MILNAKIISLDSFSKYMDEEYFKDAIQEQDMYKL